MKKKIIPISSAMPMSYNAANEKEENVIGARIAKARKSCGMTLADLSVSLES